MPFFTSKLYFWFARLIDPRSQITIERNGVLASMSMQDYVAPPSGQSASQQQALPSLVSKPRAQQSLLHRQQQQQQPQANAAPTPSTNGGASSMASLQPLGRQLSLGDLMQQRALFPPTQYAQPPSLSPRGAGGGRQPTPTPMTAANQYQQQQSTSATPTLSVSNASPQQRQQRLLQQQQQQLHVQAQLQLEPQQPRLVLQHQQQIQPPDAAARCVIMVERCAFLLPLALVTVMLSQKKVNITKFGEKSGKDASIFRLINSAKV